MLKAKDFRKCAWASLSGKWGTCALITLVYVLIMGVVGALAQLYIGYALEILLTGAFTLGYSIVALAVSNDGEVKVEMLFYGFKQYGKSLVLWLTNNIFIFLWSLLLFIPGIIKTFAYSMSYYILAENSELSASEARKESIEIMKGNKWRLFCLQFSFIGWYVLCVVTLGILYFWVMPYVQTAMAEFYNSIKINRSNGEILIDETLISE